MSTTSRIPDRFLSPASGEDCCLITTGSWSGLRKGRSRMVRAYLVQGENGRWYAKYRKSDGRWTHHSLGTPNKATAQVRFGHILKQLEERDLLFSDVRPLRLS